MNWSKKVAIVTGGASGIGAATVREFAKEGASVTIFDINEPLGQQWAKTLRDEGGEVDFFDVDVSDVGACREAVKAVVAKWGRLDFLVNCAVSFISKGLDVTPADWDRSLGVNVRGYANMVQACYAPLCAGEGKADIVVVDNTPTPFPTTNNDVQITESVLSDANTRDSTFDCTVKQILPSSDHK